MSINIDYIGVPQVANRAFVQLAIEAGIEVTINSLVGLAVDKITLLVQLKEALMVNNAPLSNALNTQTLDAILDYMSKKQGAIANANELPNALVENGPASVSAGRDGGLATQVNITFSEPPAEYVPEIYLDGIYQKDSTQQPAGGFVNDAIQNVQPGPHVIRVLFRNPEGGLTHFGPVANIN